MSLPRGMAAPPPFNREDWPACAVATLRPPPAAWRRELAGLLLSQRQIARRVRALAQRLEEDYHGRDLLLVAILNGTVLFLADLIRQLTLPVRLDFVGVSSYGAGTAPGALVMTKEPGVAVRGRDVLLVDDILDTGQTLAHVAVVLRKMRPRSLRTCVLLDKPARRRLKVQADYVGFAIPNLFVVGYGLDYAERYRNLPFIGVLRAEDGGAVGGVPGPGR